MATGTVFPGAKLPGREAHVKEDETGGECKAYGIDEKCIQNFGRKT
jgi:hypothetical protein